MPSKKDPSSSSSAAATAAPSLTSSLVSDLSTIRADELIETFSNPKVAEALIKCLKPSLCFLIEEMVPKLLAPLQRDIDTLKKDSVKMAEENKRLRLIVDAQGGRLDELERYSRRDNLIISGLPEGSYAEAGTSSIGSPDDESPVESSTATEKTVLRLLKNTMGLDISAGDITIAHRLKKGKRDSTRPIIVRLLNKRIRDSILRAKKSLRSLGGSNGNIYISEHLTQSASALLFEARKAIRDKKIASAWSMNGHIFIKHKHDDEKGIMIKSTGDLPV